MARINTKLTKVSVELIQKALRDIYGYNIAVDGIYGRNTEKALRDYAKTGGNKRTHVVKRREDEPHEDLKPVGPIDVETIKAGLLTISKESYALIVASETGGENYYNKRLKRPTWPGGASGITIGVGWDIGYQSEEDTRRAWHTLGYKQVEKLIEYSGIKGAQARGMISSLKDIQVPWETAIHVFEKYTLPQQARIAIRTFPGLEKLHPHIQGALLSIIFNRGGSTKGATRLEMLQIQRAIKNGELQKIPVLTRSMKRLWEGKGLDGLLKRREREAKLIEKGLNQILS